MVKNQKSVIIIDKNEDFRVALSLILENKYEFDVKGQAVSNQELSDIYQKLQTDFVLVGVDFDFRNEMEAVSQFISDNPLVKTIALSAFNEPTLNSYLKNIGFDEVVSKEEFYKEFKSLFEVFNTQSV